MTRLETLLILLEKDPADSFTRYAIGLEHRSAGYLQKAVDMLTRLMMDEPSYVASHYQLGRLHKELDDRATAEIVYERGMEIARSAGDDHTATELLEAIEDLQEDF